MSFNLSSSYDLKVISDTSKSILLQWDIDNDGSLDFIGLGDSLWWSSSLNDFKTFHKSSNNNYQVCIVQNTNMNSNLLEVTFVSEDGDDSSFEWFEYDINNKDFKL